MTVLRNWSFMPRTAVWALSMHRKSSAVSLFQRRYSSLFHDLRTAFSWVVVIVAPLAGAAFFQFFHRSYRGVMCATIPCLPEEWSVCFFFGVWLIETLKTGTISRMCAEAATDAADVLSRRVQRELDLFPSIPVWPWPCVLNDVQGVWSF